MGGADAAAAAGAAEVGEEQAGGMMMIVVALAAVAMTVVILLMFRKPKPKPNAALLLGLQDSGKTAVFTRLRYGEDGDLRETVTSMDINEGDLVAADTGRSVTVVDVPGNSRQLGAVLGGLYPRAGCVVFVVDAKVFQNQSQENARRMLDIFENPAFARRRMLVACNKSESPMASSAEFVRKRLEKDIELLLTTRQKDISDTGAGDGDSVSLTTILPPGQPFSFESLANAPGGWRVDFIRCSAKQPAKKPDLNLSRVCEFITGG